MKRAIQNIPDLMSLTMLFYSEPSRLGSFEAVDAGQMPEHYRELLDHQNHMTVTVEHYHGTQVDVDVLDRVIQGDHYARKILLRRKTDGAVVQFGIMRLDFSCVSDEVRQAVEGQTAPLGRLLIAHNVLREVRLVNLWQVTLGPDLAAYFGRGEGESTFGRTARIDFDGRPAVELLEIVTPAEHA